VRRHETDVTSLVFGLVFLGVAAIWALVQSDLLSLPDASVLGPAVLVVAGLVGIAVTLRRGTRGTRAARSADRIDPKGR
jgi:hypothetical protein